MDLTINNANNGMVGMIGNAATNVSQADASRMSRPVNDFTVTVPSDEIASTEPSIAVPDAAIVRDDALGKLVNSAFNLPPPPMPVFE